MRKAIIRGYIIFDEEELQHKDNIIGQIDHELFNVEGVIEWEFDYELNEEIEYIRED